MKTLITSIAIIAANIVSAAETVKTDSSSRPPLTAEQKAQLRKERREKRLAESGGLVERNILGKSTLIINAQTAIPIDCVNKAADSIRSLALVKVEVIQGDLTKRYRPTPEHPVVISVIDDPGSDTTILIAPEQNWATLNVNPLLRDRPAEDIAEARIHKQVWRATAMAMGAANSMTQPCLLRQINNLRELDRTRNMLPSPQPINNMIEVADKLGIVRVHRATYRRACQEGWAPQPTNDVQRKIWNQVHQIPDKPIKIEFNPKRDK